MPRDHRFQNWSRTIEFRPRRYVRPKTEADVVRIVNESAASRSNIRTQGSGHSFSQIVTTSDTLVDLTDQEESVAWTGPQVTVQAGMQLKRLIDVLKSLNSPLALRNMSSVTEQTIAGAISTGTHGTGLTLGAMPTQIMKLRLVDGTGTVRQLDDTSLDELRAARLSVGMLGIITQVTIECVPYYELDYDLYLCDFDEVVDDVDELNAQNERMLLWWRIPFLPTHKVAVVTKNPVGVGGRNWFDSARDLTREVGDQLGLGRLTRDFDDLGDAVAGVALDAECKHLVHRSGGYEDMLTIPLLPVYHRECEYAIPVGKTADALRAIREVLDEADATLRLPIEVRFVAADQDPLSPAYGRATTYIGIATMDNAIEVFERVEPIMKDLGGRPHWGKHFNATRSVLEAMYPDTYDAFVQLRRRYDPDGIFLNSLLRRLFA